MRTCAACCLTMKGAPLRSQQSKRCACACEPVHLTRLITLLPKGGQQGPSSHTGVT